MVVVNVRFCVCVCVCVCHLTWISLSDGLCCKLACLVYFQMSMAVELMKCVSQANSFGKFSRTPVSTPVTGANGHEATALANDKKPGDRGNVSLQFLAKASECQTNC